MLLEYSSTKFSTLYYPGKFSTTVNLVDLVVSEIDGDIDNNTVEVQMFYAVENTGISDELTLSFN